MDNNNDSSNALDYSLAELGDDCESEVFKAYIKKLEENSAGQAEDHLVQVLNPENGQLILTHLEKLHKNGLEVIAEEKLFELNFVEVTLLTNNDSFNLRALVCWSKKIANDKYHVGLRVSENSDIEDLLSQVIETPEPQERSTAENRSLQRLPVAQDSAFFIKVEQDGETLSGQVINYNSHGVAALFEKSFDPSESLDLAIGFGSLEITRVKNPFVKKHIEENTWVFGLKSQNDSTHYERRAERFNINPVMRASIDVKDPLKVDESLIFWVQDLSTMGVGVTTSLSNKHLLPDLKFKGATLNLPTSGQLEVDLDLKHIQRAGDQLRAGFEFTNICDEPLKKLTKFLYVGAEGGAIAVKTRLKKQQDAPRVSRFGSSIRITPVANNTDYLEALKVRYYAYRRHDKEGTAADFMDMAEDIDENSHILLAKVGTSTAGTLRLTHCDKKEDRFTFEELVDFEKVLPDDSRQDYYEVSKLAVHPSFMGTDIWFKLFQKTAAETIPNKKGCLLLTTSHNEKYYTSAGATLLVSGLPHPVLENEKLSLYAFYTKDFTKGTNMLAIAWFNIAKEANEFLADWKVIAPPSTRLRHKIMHPVEKFILKSKKRRKK